MRIYGPVPSRRFGLSLGVDLLPRKTCSFDCIYCQVGSTDNLTSSLQDFYTIDEIVADVEEALEDGPRPDLITFAGSGEPTLYKSLGQLIDCLHAQFDIPILLITNSSLLWKKDVADAALFLASDQSEFISGVLLNVDGGRHLATNRPPAV